MKTMLTWKHITFVESVKALFILHDRSIYSERTLETLPNLRKFKLRNFRFKQF
jgi:hypothetical protein